LGSKTFDSGAHSMERRRFFLSRLAGLPLLAMAASDGARGQVQGQNSKPLKIMMKSAWGSDDPTKAAFPFSHGLALAEAGHEVRIFLLGEAVVLMRKVVAEAVTPVGWPKIAETLDKLAARHTPIYACGACSRARGVTEADLNNYGAKYGNPTIFVSLVEWCDKVITE
jgi:sulfur relay (sulfurtransferase) complex TusBCD TusD component (DsrE family)